MSFRFLLAGALGLAASFCLPAAADEAWVVGYTRAIADLNLSMPVSGRVETLHVREGACMAAGAPLLELDNRLEALEVQRRRAMLDNRAELNGALARLPLVNMQLRSARTLFSNSAAVSREEVQSRELAVIATTADIEMRRALKEVERLEHEAAREVLDRRTLRAPVAGCVVRILRFPGESVQALETVLRLVNTERLLFISGVEAAVARQLRLGDAVSLNPDIEDADAQANGAITFIAPVADPASGLVEIRAEFANPDDRLRAGTRARLRLQGR
jgi:RND family efflux transporter MFP subunit